MVDPSPMRLGFYLDLIDGPLDPSSSERHGPAGSHWDGCCG
jgi:hypothetical protein